MPMRLRRLAADAEQMAKAFEKGLPSAKVIWIEHGSHYIFRSHEAEVLREMNSFIGGLTPKEQQEAPKEQ